MRGAAGVRRRMGNLPVAALRRCQRHFSSRLRATNGDNVVFSSGGCITMLKVVKSPDSANGNRPFRRLWPFSRVFSWPFLPSSQVPSSLHRPPVRFGLLDALLESGHNVDDLRFLFCDGHDFLAVDLRANQFLERILLPILHLDVFKTCGHRIDEIDGEVKLGFVRFRGLAHRARVHRA